MKYLAFGFPFHQILASSPKKLSKDDFCWSANVGREKVLFPLHRTFHPKFGFKTFGETGSDRKEHQNQSGCDVKKDIFR